MSVEHHSSDARLSSIDQIGPEWHKTKRPPGHCVPWLFGYGVKWMRFEVGTLVKDCAWIWVDLSVGGVLGVGNRLMFFCVVHVISGSGLDFSVFQDLNLSIIFSLSVCVCVCVFVCVCVYAYGYCIRVWVKVGGGKWYVAVLVKTKYSMTPFSLWLMSLT